MKRGNTALPRFAAIMALATLTGCASSAAEAPAAAPRPVVTGGAPATPQAQPQDSAPSGRGGGAQGAAAPRPYARVITSEAVTKSGLFKVHKVGERLFFEIPRSELGKELLVAQRTQAGGVMTGGGNSNRVMKFQREGNRLLLRLQSYAVRADSSNAIYQAVNAMNYAPIIAAMNIEAFGTDSAAVVDVTRLFTTNITEFVGVPAIQADRSFVDSFVALPENINVVATQTGTAPAPAAPAGGGGGRGGAAGGGTVSMQISWSIFKLPENRMRPRLWDGRVGLGSISYIDYSRSEHEAKTLQYIRRYRLEKQNPNAAMSDPQKKIVFYVDRATPAWLVPHVIQGINDWEPAYREAGFSNAIEGRLAPSPAQDPNFSLLDARHSVIYWRPSETENANGGQVVDPRTGEIIKAEVQMFHNVMNLLRNWYFIQVSPLDPRTQSLPMPDSLMGRLVRYVVAHEVGHAIGFPHNMKASSQYPADSVRSASFLRRMGGHVATLMDYSRFNYVAQPEDNIPVDLLVPGIGPYDRFAIMWQNKPIPGARTPEDEWPTLNNWSRMQDTIPWLRWSTSSATADPFDLTEAVGDQDAVKSSTLAMKNLERVVASLLRVSERPGQDYSLLSELYGQTIGQWGRYNNHVAAIIGGAETQERYGTGPRFTPLSEARQKEAVRYLNENAFRVPAMFTNRDILLRIEQEGVVNRIRAAQAGVLGSLLSAARLGRLVDYEALAGTTGNPYTIAEYLGDLRNGVWSELSSGNARVDVYRRNLQRAYLDAAERTLNPPEPAAPAGGGGGGGGAAAPPPRSTDARALLRGELFEIQRLAQTAANRTSDPMTRLHLRDINLEIQRILDPTR